MALENPGRTPRRAAVLVMVVALCVTTFAACSSGGNGGRAERVRLVQLAAGQDHYSGRQVETSGTVRRFGQGAQTYYVIEDAAHNRVEVDPPERFAGLVGSEVTVTGRFDFDESRGRRLVATAVRPAT